MHGTVNEVCAWLLENYIPGCVLTVLVWTVEDVEVCSEDMGITEQEAAVSVGPPPAGGCSQSPVTGRESAGKVFPYAKRFGIMFRDGKQGDGA